MRQVTRFAGGAAGVYLLAMCMAGAAAAMPTVTPGGLEYQDDLGGVRWRKFNDPAGFEQFLGIDPGSATFRVGRDITWDSTNTVAFDYDQANDRLTATVVNGKPGSPFVQHYTSYAANLAAAAMGGSPLHSGNFGIADLNFLRLLIVVEADTVPPIDPSGVSFTGVTLNGDALGDFVGVIGSALDWSVTGADLSAGFTLTGTLNLSGPFSGCDECSKLEIHFGHRNVCDDGVIDPGGQNGPAEDCEDGNALDGDCCSSTCAFEPLDSPCADGTVCNGMELCDGAGLCLPGQSLSCDDGDPCTQDSCDTLGGCVNDDAPRSSCRTATKNLLIVRKAAGGAKDKLVWRWVKGAATTQAELADPISAADYALCIYAGTAAVVDADLGHGSNWRALGTKGYKFRDATAAQDGIRKAILKGGAANKAKVLVKGKGPNLDDPALPLALPVVVQLSKAGSSLCFESTFATATKNLPDRFKAKAP